MTDRIETLREVQALAKSGGCFVVFKNHEYLLYRQMPVGVQNQLVGKRTDFRQFVSLVRRAVTKVNDTFNSIQLAFDY